MSESPIQDEFEDELCDQSINTDTNRADSLLNKM